MEIYIRNFMICAERNLDVRLYLEIYEKWINKKILFVWEIMPHQIRGMLKAVAPNLFLPYFEAVIFFFQHSSVYLFSLQTKFFYRCLTSSMMFNFSSMYTLLLKVVSKFFNKSEKLCS